MGVNPVTNQVPAGHGSIPAAQPPVSSPEIDDRVDQVIREEKTSQLGSLGERKVIEAEPPANRPLGLAIEILSTEPSQTPASLQQRPSRAWYDPRRLTDAAVDGISWVGKKSANLAVESVHLTVDGISWVGKQSVHLAENFVVSESALKKSQEQDLAKLREMTGEENLGVFLTSISPKLLEVLESSVLQDGQIKNLVKSEDKLLNSLLETLLIRMAVNLGADLREQPEFQGKQVSTVDIVAHLGKLLSDGISSVEDQLAEAETLFIPVERENAQKKAIAPAVDNLLKKLLPNGSADLPINKALRGLVWSQIKVGVQKGVIELAQTKRYFDSKESLTQLKDNPEAALLVRVSQEASIVISQWGPDIIADPQIAASLAEKMGAALLPGQDALNPWFASQIAECGQNPVLKGFWKYLGESGESVLARIFQNMASTNKPGDDAAAGIAMNLMEKVQVFVAENHEKIAKLRGEIEQEGSVPETDPRYIELFQSLALQCEFMLGITAKSSELPKGIRIKLKELIAKELPVLLAKNYQEYLVPLAEMGEAIVTPQPATIKEGLVGSDGVRIAAKCEAVGKAVKTRVQDFLGASDTAEKPSPIAKIVADEVSVAVPALKGFLLKKLGSEGTKARDSQLQTQAGDLKQWITEWVNKQGLVFAKSKDPRILNFWAFIQNRVDDVLARGLINGSAGGAVDENAATTTINRVLETVGGFATEHGGLIFEQYEQLLAEGKVPEEDPEFVKNFESFTQTVLSVVGMHEEGSIPVPKFIDKMVRKALDNPTFLAKQYREAMTPRECLAEYQGRLEEWFKLADLNSASENAQVFENLCDVLSEKLVGTVEQAANKAIVDFTKQGDKLKGLEAGINLIRDRYLKDVVKSILMQTVVHYLEGINMQGDEIKREPMSVVLSRLANLLQVHIEDDKERIMAAATKKGTARANALREAFTPLANDLVKLFRAPGDTTEGLPLVLPFPNLLQGMWPEIKEKALPDLLAAMYMDTTSWVKRMEVNEELIKTRVGTSHIPETARGIGEWVGEFVPAFLYRERNDLAKMVYEEASLALRADGSASEKEVAAFLEKNKDKLQGLISDCFKYFDPNSPLIKIVQPLAKTYVRAALVNLFNGLTKKIADIESPMIQISADGKMGNNPNYRKDFFAYQAIKMVEHVSEHFKNLNELVKDKGKSAIYQLPHGEMIEKLETGGIRHPGLPRSAEAVKARADIKKAIKTLNYERKLYGRLRGERQEKCMERIREAQKDLSAAKKIENREREAFFKPFVKALFELGGVDSADKLPFPAMKEKLWELFSDKLMPLAFQELYNKLLEPDTRSIMVIGGLNSLRHALDDIDQERKREGIKEVGKSKESGEAMPANAMGPKTQEEQLQSDLNTAFGEVVRELVQTVPWSMVKAAFKIERVNDLTAEVIGKAVRNQLRKDYPSLMSALNKAMKEVVLALASGSYWQDEGTRAKLVGPEGGDLDISILTNLDQLEAEEREKLEETENNLKYMRQLMIDTTHRLVAESISSALSKPGEKIKQAFKLVSEKTMANSFLAALATPFIKFKEAWDWSVDKVFGKYSQEVRQFFKKLGDNIVIDALKRFGEIVGHTFAQIFWFFMDIHIGLKADAVIKSLQLDIHENLLYQLSDELTASIKDPERIISDASNFLIAKVAADLQVSDDEARRIRKEQRRQFRSSPKKKTGSELTEPAS